MADVETASWISSALALIGVSGSSLVAWIFKVSNGSAAQAVRLDKMEEQLDGRATHGYLAHEVRIERLESDIAAAVADISSTAATCARLDERTIRTGEEVSSILGLLRGRALE